MKFPKFSLVEFNEAVKRNIIQLDGESKLLMNPEKYNIFNIELDFENPVLREALFNLKIDSSECSVLNYSKFRNDDTLEIYSIMNYLMYLKSKYCVIKAVIKERNRIKKAEIEVRNKF